MSGNTFPKKPGRPALPPELKRTARISVRTYPEIAEKVARNGTEWLEALIRKAKDAPITCANRHSNCTKTAHDDRLPRSLEES